MNSQEIRLFAPNLICIGVDETRSSDYSGRIWHQYQDEPIPYHNTMTLLSEMERLYNDWNFPQESTVIREFRKKNRSMEYADKKEARPQMDAKRIQNKKGNMGTFIVHVKYRQNATWQGEVIWAEQKKKQCFRSALELLRLMDSALDEAETEAEFKAEENED